MKYAIITTNHYNRRLPNQYTVAACTAILLKEAVATAAADLRKQGLKVLSVVYSNANDLAAKKLKQANLFII